MLSLSRILPKHTFPTLFDILFVAVLPALCFALDPVLTRGSLGSDMTGLLSEPSTMGLYTAVTLCSLFFFLSYLKPQSGLAAGGIIAGGLLSFALGVLLLPFSVLGLALAGLGLLGLIPFVTSHCFFRRLRTLRESKSSRSRDWVSYLAGMVVILLSAAAAYEFTASENERLFAKLRSSSEAEVVTNLQQLLNSWTCSSNCQIRIFYMVMRQELPMTTEEFEAQISSFLGREYRVYVDCIECVTENYGD